MSLPSPGIPLHCAYCAQAPPQPCVCACHRASDFDRCLHAFVHQRLRVATNAPARTRDALRSIAIPTDLLLRYLAERLASSTN